MEFFPALVSGRAEEAEMVGLEVVTIELKALVGAGVHFSPAEAQDWAGRASGFIAEEDIRDFMHDELMVALASNAYVSLADHDGELMVAQLNALKVLGRIEGIVRGRYVWKAR
ncbi:MAG: hypothetical protein KF914_09705 [Rhizobiaceae bacterium]|nr:hypothetical protein [Rhizobiaceae bacterium]